MTSEQLLLEKWRTLSTQKKQKVFEYLETLSTEEMTDSSTAPFQPKTLLGKKLWALRAKALEAQPPLLTWEELEIELAQRTGEKSEPLKTYLDFGVLIAVARASDEMTTKALLILDDPSREFVSSAFVKLEVLSKAIYHKQQEEVEVYQGFESCSLWADDLISIVQLAQDLAAKYRLGALDALHLASALSVDADEFITTEKPTKPLHRVTEILVISLAD